MERKRINRLKVVLAEKGMTNKQLSEILDKDPAVLSKWVTNLTWQLIRNYYTDRDGGQQFQQFAPLKRIVQQWYDEQIEVLGGDEEPEEMKRLVILWQQSKILII